MLIEDLGSKNGVFINGRPQSSGSMMPGDRVRFGTVEYALIEDVAADPEQADQTIVRIAVPADALHPIDRTALAALLATSRELMACNDLAALLDRVLDRLQTILKPDRSAILLVDPATGELRPSAVRPPGAYTSVSDFASSTIVRQALAARELLIISDAGTDSRVQHAASVRRAGVRSVICVPLLGRARQIGALYADQVGSAGAFTPELAQYAAAFASQAAAALETAQLYDDREQHFRATLEAFAKGIDARDHYTAGHSERVTVYTRALAGAMGMEPGELETARRACMLHDIGKVGVPDAILFKPGPLDPSERGIMESHVTIGHGMLQAVPFLRDAMPGIRGHHERWDGRGYPDRLAATDIHLHPRLMAVADSYDAMTSDRHYRGALPVDEAARRLREGSGAQFDPAAIELFDTVEAEFRAIHARFCR
ncbi:MAG: hypothetical protein A3F69_03795 [Acidobacteria bacterium RIFCSPLOWO2_12_FULL_66_10]|nr:MAG: hypothetical protein A3F69_03795 [Acidobacteria bacterium RIFCSPLOWO2_12_FULL_66_10]